MTSEVGRCWYQSNTVHKIMSEAAVVIELLSDQYSSFNMCTVEVIEVIDEPKAAVQSPSYKFNIWAKTQLVLYSNLAITQTTVQVRTPADILWVSIKHRVWVSIKHWVVNLPKLTLWLAVLLQLSKLLHASHLMPTGTSLLSAQTTKTGTWAPKTPGSAVSFLALRLPEIKICNWFSWYV